MDALKRKMEIAAVAFFCTVTALIAVYSCATTAAANLARQTAAEPVTEYVTLAYTEAQPEDEQEPELLYAEKTRTAIDGINAEILTLAKAQADVDELKEQ